MGRHYPLPGGGAPFATHQDGSHLLGPPQLRIQAAVANQSRPNHATKKEGECHRDHTAVIVVLLPTDSSCCSTFCMPLTTPTRSPHPERVSRQSETETSRPSRFKRSSIQDSGSHRLPHPINRLASSLSWHPPHRGSSSTRQRPN